MPWLTSMHSQWEGCSTNLELLSHAIQAGRAGSIAPIMAHVHLNRQQNRSNHWIGHPGKVRAACYKCRVKLDLSLIHDRLAFNHCRWPDIQQKLASRDHCTALEDLKDFVDYDKTPIQPWELQAAKAASVLWTDKLPYFKLEEDLTAEERAQCKDVYGSNPLQELYFIHFRAMATPVNNSRRPGKSLLLSSTWRLVHLTPFVLQIFVTN